MKSDLPRTYATLSFVGDELDPEDISAILHTAPKRAHRKGQSFYAGRKAGTLTGRTGVWYFDTRETASQDMVDHLRQIVLLLYPTQAADRVNSLRDVLSREHATAHVSCFWYGHPGSRPPAIPDEVRTALATLPADIETEFHAD
jgi:hypothetical protein